MKTNVLLSLLMVAALAACGKKADVPAAPVEAAAPAPAPPAAPAPAPIAAPPMAAASPEVLAAGEKVYTATCAACHGAGVLGAPKLADKALWGPRMAKGKAALYTSAMDGVRMMPPRGGNPALKDDELKSAVDFMVSKAL